MNYTLRKDEKLKSKKQIEHLFLEGNRVKNFPFHLIYLKDEHYADFPIKVAFSVPKRNIKLAVNRNRIKRLMREIYRLNKHKIAEGISEKYKFMFIYMGKEEMSYANMEVSYLKLVEKFLTKIKNDEE